MEVKIIKKTVKEGTSSKGDYSIKSLFVTFTDKNIYEKIVLKLTNDGATPEMIEKFCKPNDYNGVVSYSFGLNCSDFTFNNVERFGILDANIHFFVNGNFCNARIAVKDKIESVNAYTPPESEVTGWNVPTPSPKIEESKPENKTPTMADLIKQNNVNNDLPF